MSDPVECKRCHRIVYGWLKAWKLKGEKLMAFYECPYCGHKFRRILKTK